MDFGAAPKQIVRKALIKLKRRDGFSRNEHNRHEMRKIAPQHCPPEHCPNDNHNYLNFIIPAQLTDSTHGPPYPSPKNRQKPLTGAVPLKQEKASRARP